VPARNNHRKSLARLIFAHFAKKMIDSDKTPQNTRKTTPSKNHQQSTASVEKPVEPARTTNITPCFL
jgi:hypothetical protein